MSPSFHIFSAAATVTTLIALVNLYILLIAAPTQRTAMKLLGTPLRVKHNYCKFAASLRLPAFSLQLS